MESEWVKIYPYLGLVLPEKAVNDDYVGVKESKEIYDFFKAVSPNNTVKSFIKFYSTLPNRPKYGQSKMSQVVESVRILRLAKNMKAKMKAMGIRK